MTSLLLLAVHRDYSQESPHHRSHLQGILMFTESLISNGQPGKPDL